MFRRLLKRRFMFADLPTGFDNFSANLQEMFATYSSAVVCCVIELSEADLFAKQLKQWQMTF